MKKTIREFLFEAENVSADNRAWLKSKGYHLQSDIDKNNHDEFLKKATPLQKQVYDNAHKKLSEKPWFKGKHVETGNFPSDDDIKRYGTEHSGDRVYVATSSFHNPDHNRNNERYEVMHRNHPQYNQK